MSALVDRRCIWDGDPAIVDVYLSHGCAARDDRRQALCAQHWYSLEPAGDLVVLWSAS